MSIQKNRLLMEAQVKRLRGQLTEGYRYGKDKKMDILNSVANSFAMDGDVTYAEFIKRAKSKGVNISSNELQKLLDDWAFLEDVDTFWVDWDNNKKIITFDDPSNI